MLNVIPRPAYAEEKFGEFVINSDTTVYADDQLAYARDALLNCVEKACGYRIQVVVSRKAQIQFLFDRHVAREGYVLEATTESLVVRASAIAGAFYAVQTISARRRDQGRTRLRIPRTDVRRSPIFPRSGYGQNNSRHDGIP